MTTSTKRIFGIETEYGITCAGPQGPVLTPDEAARYLFRKIVAWGRSSNVFLHNGSRLYLDVGSHPEYATAECDSITQLIAHDRAGERILADLISDAQEKITSDGIDGTLHLFKNNTDSAGNSYGCHENYLLRRSGDFTRFADVLIPFLITRQILVGAGSIIATGKTAFYAFSQRADHMWEAMSSATTRSRPIINTRDEPHADADLYRRLHVIVGDSSIAEPTTLLKVGSTDLVLRLIENHVMMRDLTLASPMRAIREISHDITGTAPVELADGRTMTAVDLQAEYLQRVERFVTEHDQLDDTTAQILDLWRRTLEAIRTQDLSGIDREIDWAIKLRLIERYQAKHGFELDDPRIARLMLSYHDILPRHSIHHKLVQAGLIRQIVNDTDVVAAMDAPPQTTRAKLRGDFIRAAQAAHRDYTVDWVHLKVNDQIQRTVLCKDPFAAVDERVDKLIEAISR